jgi:hypothetical protein
MGDGSFRTFVHNSTEVQARRVDKITIVKTDRGKIVLHAGDWEIIDEDGTVYANTDEKFQRNYREK